ncbi:MAG: translation initiation factor IF-2 [Candidatus Alcyoniella australis]|nr:translation initiation factor IF-2 [Candidatus Alcyoniella australis]
MAKITVSEAAKRLGIPPDEFLRKLKELGVNVIDGFSELSQERFKQVRILLEKREEPVDPDEVVVKKRISGGVIRKRRKHMPATESPVAAEPVEQPLQPEDEASVEPLEAALEAPEPEQELTAVESLDEPEISEPEQAPEKSEEEAGLLPEEEVEHELDVDELEIDEELDAGEMPVQSIEPEQIHVANKEIEVSKRPMNTIEQALLSQRRAKVAKEARVLRTKMLAEQAKARKANAKDDSYNAKILEKPAVLPEHLKPQVPSRPADSTAPAKPGRKGRRVIEVLPDTSGRRSTTSASRKREAYERERAERAERMFSRKVKRGRQSKIKRPTTMPPGVKQKIRIVGDIIVSDLAKRMGIKAGELIKKLMGMGMMVTINMAIDPETATILGDDLGFTVENVEKHEQDFLAVEQDSADDLQPRSPVVTIMGHVDHGKTSLLDSIRSTRVAQGEAGGITQHIGAYKVQLKTDDVAGEVVFLDTPGHEAFTAMRARGAKSTDIVVLIVAADDGVMPQTRESINHAKAAEVPIIVAINKIDKPESQPDRVRQELTEFNLLSEEWGGETLFTEVSAKQNTGIEKLLEQILLQAELLELKANPNKAARGVVIESRMERGRGPVATILIQQGTLHVGDPLVVGTILGRVRSMSDDQGTELKEAGPSTPVEVMGLTGVPEAGEVFNSPKDEKAAKQLIDMRQDKQRQSEGSQLSRMRLEDFYDKLQEGETKELRLVLKADVQGSIGAIQESLEKLSTEQTKVEIIHTGVGAINESDVNLAVASGAVIIGFSIRPEPKAKKLADQERIDIKLYTVIYELIEDVQQALKGMLDPVMAEVFLGRAEVRNIFHISRLGTIAGCSVIDGKMLRNAQVRLVRDGTVIYEGKISSLKRFKDDAREVATGFECGIGLESYNDIKDGDHIECFKIEEQRQE